VTRAIKGVEEAGRTPERVEVDPATGKISIVLRGEATTSGANSKAANPWDKVLLMLRTKSGLPKHCRWNRDHHGKQRIRFRLCGFSTYLTGTPFSTYFIGTPWSEDFMRQYAAALEGAAETTSGVGVRRTVPGSVNALIVSYYRSSEFCGLKASTQAMRRNIIERFRVEHISAQQTSRVLPGKRSTCR
jgi:hypothetical protein